MTKDTNTIVVNAEGAILGRLATYAAKALLSGYRVYIVNAEKAVVSGNRLMVIDSYRVWLKIKTLRNPSKWSPKRPRNPIAIVRRAIKGMLPKESWRGTLAFKNLRVYVGCPEHLKGHTVIRLADADASRLGRRYVSISEIAKALGWKG